MRHAVVIGALALAFASVQEAQARGGRGGGGRGGGGIVYATPARTHDASARRTATAGMPVEPQAAFLRPILPVRAPVQAIQPASTGAVAANCASGRLVGQGAGFCQIN
ncbi:hypothetical protein [Methylobacterium sp. Leaf108]|uniref:hypothetical protein n=1 Tax=Methylobacterium sp. Leaf108 TaxID=1736256 RepID=UPI0006FEED85|nr:hypothetical protein [Methylobacterium sp. Leaf108]KQP55230.1 hypothetical protein ASF39_05855 [Methylobacterium sp. Leaf108]